MKDTTLDINSQSAKPQSTFVETISNNKHSSNNQIMTVYPVEGTQFKIIETEQGCWITFGAWRLCEAKETKEQCLEMINNKDWEIITSLVGAAYEAYYLREKKIIQDTEKNNNNNNNQNQ